MTADERLLQADFKADIYADIQIIGNLINI